MKTPYEIYKRKKEWKLVQSAIKSLEKNNDLKLLTHSDYIVGCICKKLAKRKAK